MKPSIVVIVTVLQVILEQQYECGWIHLSLVLVPAALALKIGHGSSGGHSVTGNYDMVRNLEHGVKAGQPTTGCLMLSCV